MTEHLLQLERFYGANFLVAIIYEIITSFGHPVLRLTPKNSQKSRRRIAKRAIFSLCFFFDQFIILDFANDGHGVEVHFLVLGALVWQRLPLVANLDLWESHTHIIVCVCILMDIQRCLHSIISS